MQILEKETGDPNDGAGAISVVMPAYNARRELPCVLPPLLEALGRGELLEVIVVDDCSTDASGDYCRERGLTVLCTPTRSGPGGARNLGVESARGKIVLFIDADVVMHASVPSIVASAFVTQERPGAVFGSYDDQPAERNFVSQYMNLRHHYIHQQGREEASTFWAGCGAVDRAAFLEVCGFDTQRFAKPSIEDVELGHRLRRAGRSIRLCKEMQAKHLKHWTLRSMIHTDILRRAIPWSRLLHQHDCQGSELNVNSAERGRAFLAGLLVLSVTLVPLRPEALYLVSVLLILAYLANREFFKLVRRSAGFSHMLAALLLHQLYYLYSSAVYVYCGVEALVKQPRR